MTSERKKLSRRGLISSSRARGQPSDWKPEPRPFLLAVLAVLIMAGALSQAQSNFTVFTISPGRMAPTRVPPQLWTGRAVCMGQRTLARWDRQRLRVDPCQRLVDSASALWLHPSGRRRRQPLRRSDHRSRRYTLWRHLVWWCGRLGHAVQRQTFITPCMFDCTLPGD